MRQRFPSVSALEFRWRREIPSVNQKLTFEERIGCITRHDDFSPRSHRTVSLQVVPFLRDCTCRGYRSDRRAGQTERKTSEFIVIWFKFISNRDFNREKPLEFKCSIDLCIPRISEFDSWTQRKHTHQNNSDRAKSHYVIMWLTIKKSMSTKGGGVLTHSTVTALLEATDSWAYNIDCGKTNAVVFLDLKKAFDTVDHEILLSKLSHHGICWNASKWFKLYLENRTQMCSINWSLSNNHPLTCGVP